MDPTVQEMTAFENRTGIIVQPGVGNAWPELRENMWRLISEKVLNIPWVPEAVKEEFLFFHAKYPSIVARVGPPYMLNGTRNRNYPAWLDSKAKLDAWMEVSEAMRKAYVEYANKRRLEGLREVERLTANAEMWDRLYRAAVFVRDVPKNIIGGAAGAVNDIALGIVGDVLKKAWPILLVGGVVVLVYYNRATIAKKIAKG